MAATGAKPKLTGKERERFMKLLAHSWDKNRNERVAFIEKWVNLLEGLGIHPDDALREIYASGKTPSPPPVDTSDLQLELEELRVLNDTLRAQLKIADVKSSKLGSELFGYRFGALTGNYKYLVGPLESQIYVLQREATEQQAERKQLNQELRRNRQRLRFWRRAAFAVSLGLCLVVAVFVLAAAQGNIDRQRGARYLREQQKRENVLGMQVLSLEQKLSKLEKTNGARPGKVAAR